MKKPKRGGGTRACETQNPDPLFVLPAPVIPETLTPEPSWASTRERWRARERRWTATTAAAAGASHPKHPKPKPLRCPSIVRDRDDDRVVGVDGGAKSSGSTRPSSSKGRQVQVVIDTDSETLAPNRDPVAHLALFTGPLAWKRGGWFLTLNLLLISKFWRLIMRCLLYMSTCNWLSIVDYNVYDVKWVHNGDAGWDESWTTRTEPLVD